MTAANTSPSLSQKAVPGTQPGAARRKPAGKVPAWALKVGTLFATFSIFAGSFGYATTHLYASNAPLQPATIAASAASSSSATNVSGTGSTAASATTTLTSSVRTTTQTAVTTTRHS